jgi:hypothetical protein
MVSWDLGANWEQRGSVDGQPRALVASSKEEIEQIPS